jgi:hypothetical protein
MHRQLLIAALVLLGCRPVTVGRIASQLGMAGIAHPLVVLPTGDEIAIDASGSAHVRGVNGGWQNVGAPASLLVAGLAPVATHSFTGAFGYGSDGHLYQLAYTPSGWQWSDDGAPPTSACPHFVGTPAASGPDDVSVLVTCDSGALVEAHNDIGKWTWDVRGQPAGTSVVDASFQYRAAGGLSGAVMGADHQLYYFRAPRALTGPWTYQPARAPATGTIASPIGFVFTYPVQSNANTYEGAFAITDDGRPWEWLFVVEYSWLDHVGLWLPRSAPATEICPSLTSSPFSFYSDNGLASRFGVARCSSDAHTIVRLGWLGTSGAFVWSAHRDGNGAAFVGPPFASRLPSGFGFVVMREDGHVVRFFSPSMVTEWTEADDGVPF